MRHVNKKERRRLARVAESMGLPRGYAYKPNIRLGKKHRRQRWAG